MVSAIACVTGLMGCWKASGDHLISTCLLMLMAALSAAAGMGFWHGADFYERFRVRFFSSNKTFLLTVYTTYNLRFDESNNLYNCLKTRFEMSAWNSS